MSVHKSLRAQILVLLSSILLAMLLEEHKEVIRLRGRLARLLPDSDE